MSALQAIPTEHGIDILNSELKSTVTKYRLIGALTHDAANNQLYSFHEANIETSYFDDNGVLTFILNLPIEIHFNEYLHKIHVLDSTNQIVIECETPKIALAKGIGGMVTLKTAISGQAGDVIFKHSEFVTENELTDIHLAPMLHELNEKLDKEGGDITGLVTSLSVLRFSRIIDDITTKIGYVGPGSGSHNGIHFNSYLGESYILLKDDGEIEYRTGNNKSHDFHSPIHEDGERVYSPNNRQASTDTEYLNNSHDLNDLPRLEHRSYIIATSSNAPANIPPGASAGTILCLGNLQMYVATSGKQMWIRYYSSSWLTWEIVAGGYQDNQSTTGYSTLPNGLTLQWMDVAYSTANIWQKFTLPKSFNSQCVSWSAMYRSTSNAQFAGITQNNTSAHNVSEIEMTAERVGTYMVFALGY